jgi:FKBP-type peptidyl-prolyl cis-trans isomerase
MIWPALFAVSLAGNAALVWAMRRPAAVSQPSPAPAAVPGVSQAARPVGVLANYAALGTFISENNRIPDLGWTPAQFDAFSEGLRASYEGRGYPLDDDARKLRDDISARVQRMLAAAQPDPVQEYFRLLREHEAVKQTPSGLHYRVTLEGHGKAPSPDSIVVYSFTAGLPGGKSLPGLSRSRVRSGLANLLPGMREGLLLLRKGGKALIYVPPSLSFGDGEWPPDVPKGQVIVFFIELNDVVSG